MSTDTRETRRILVIDDDEVVRELLSTLLTTQGHVVELAGSGEEALARLDRPDPPRVILTDLQMPGLEGEALTTALRERAGPRTLLVGMSGRQPPEAVLLPLDAFLTKPFSSKQLEETLAEARSVRDRSFSASGRLPSAPAVPAAAAEPEISAVDVPLDEGIFSALAKSFPPAALLELYELTLNDVRQRHARMESHAAAGNLDELKREAHAVKGACGMVGARELQHLAAALEGGTTLDTSELLKIPEACRRLRRMLDAKLQQ